MGVNGIKLKKIKFYLFLKVLKDFFISWKWMSDDL